MKESKVWLITGAGSGIGLEIAKAALAAGNKVVATGRDTSKVTKAIGNTADSVLVVKMDVTNPKEISTGVNSAIEKFGTIDVLVNNAGNWYAGFFEELSPAQMERQMATNLFGPMNVTRAVLPVMRKNKSGHIISISSTAALVGYELCSAYAASKFGLEGWMESLNLEIAPFGINTTIVEPGFFRTSLLEPSSTIWSELQLEDYADRIAALKPWWESMSGKQGGDPAKLAAELLTIAAEKTPPKRWMAGADAISEAERKAKELIDQANAYRELSSSLAYEPTAV
ncbi:SDR family oxidoreductase [Chitinophaga ginsengisoli]|uniref:NADP-dependent 3-hydroxy acid dehydrogenase YdfG n=1 Tax=Chitinophaga ginsengisoli TaxID=363837 RepID=A0A2P8FNP1_9BACT|nr:SDR family oxidoreductase [Chitinophaga ginsengisoli]PSL23342.1 NADP-dependent 3-hydroxy acid dehydrogenase YdfG [Chitinophaga ginsengisoli]